jgi:hypothetical protein
MLVTLKGGPLDGEQFDIEHPSLRIKAWGDFPDEIYVRTQRDPHIYTYTGPDGHCCCPEDGAASR